jgi:hypothetical protein
MDTRIEVASITLATLLAAILFAIAMDRLSSKLTGPRRLSLALLLALLSLPGFAFCTYYLHILPEMEWLYQLRSYRGSGLWLAVPLAAVVSWNAFLYRPFALLLYASAIITVALPYAKPLLRPLDQSLLHDQWLGSACLQSTESTCGPASAATVCRILHRNDISESLLAHSAWSSASGTEAWYLAQALRKQGLSAEFQFQRFPTNPDLPGILGVRLGHCGHFIAILRRDGDQWTIADPLVGEETVSLQELKRRYSISSFFLHIH